MAIDPGKAHVYNLAKMCATRWFVLYINETPQSIAPMLVEQNGLEEKINLGNLDIVEESPIAYDDKKVCPISFKAMCERFTSTLDRMENYAYEVPILRKGIPELEKLARGEPANMKLVRKAYWVLEQKPFAPDSLQDPSKLQLYLQAAKDCSVTEHSSPDRIFIDNTQLLCKIWNGNTMAFAPLTYYMTPHSSDGKIVDPPSLKFRKQLEQLTENSI